jgi:2-polyprenyl-3-methyl-5-hydroxy-6-metoxy-1,4-benzoquinol methylase
LPTNYRNQLFNNYNKTHVAHLDSDDKFKVEWFKEYVITNYLPHLRDRNKNSTRILEIGCNKGYLLNGLADSGFKQLFGIDLSADDVKKAKKLLPKSQISNINAFSYLDDKSNKFDVIILKAVLEHIPKGDVMPLLKKIYTALNFEGIVIVDVPNMDWLFATHERYMDFTHEVGFTRESLAQIMRNIFTDVFIFQGQGLLKKTIRSKIRMLLRPLLILSLNFIFKIIGEGLSDVWWTNRSIIAIGKKKFGSNKQGISQ